MDILIKAAPCVLLVSAMRGSLVSRSSGISRGLPQLSGGYKISPTFSLRTLLFNLILLSSSSFIVNQLWTNFKFNFLLPLSISTPTRQHVRHYSQQQPIPPYLHNRSLSRNCLFTSPRNIDSGGHHLQLCKHQFSIRWRPWLRGRQRERERLEYRQWCERQLRGFLWCMVYCPSTFSILFCQNCATATIAANKRISVTDSLGMYMLDSNIIVDAISLGDVAIGCISKNLRR